MIWGERMDQHGHGAQLRRMERGDLQTVLDLINIEGWDYYISELERMIAVDPENSVIACSGNMIVGAITVAVSGGRCVLGHVVVRNGWRNKGIGRIMMDHLAKKMDSQGVGVMEAFAVKAAVAFYKRHGYQTIEEIDTYDRVLTDQDVLGVPEEGGRIAPIEKGSLDNICRLDRTITGFDRKDFLNQLMGEFPAMAKGLFEDTEMAGFILARTNPIMNDIGPWVMERPDLDDGIMML